MLLTGPKEAVEKLVDEEQILETKTLGNQINMMADLPYHENLIQKAKEHGVKVEKAPLQDYLVQITHKQKRVNVR